MARTTIGTVACALRKMTGVVAPISPNRRCNCRPPMSGMRISEIKHPGWSMSISSSSFKPEVYVLHARCMALARVEIASVDLNSLSTT